MNIVITGASRGIGKQLTEYYLDRGNVVFGCSRSNSDISDARYHHCQVDLTSEVEINAFAKFVRGRVKSIDALINNAGIASMNHFMFTPLATAENLMKVNYLAAFACTRAFVNLIKKSQHPRIVNFSTVAVPLNLEGELAYAASKSAVESLTKVLAKELATFNITVNAVGPAPTPTNLIAKVPEEKLKKIIDAQAIKRYGEISDIINVIDFFISPKSDFVTGQILYLGGICR